MKRINLIKNQITPNLLSNNSLNKSLPILSANDYFKFDDFLTKEEKEYRIKLRNYLDLEIAPELEAFLEKKEPPIPLVKKLIKSFPGILGTATQGYGSIGCSLWLEWCIVMELARIDLSLSTFMIVTGGPLVIKTIHLLGNESQRQEYLPKLNKLENIGSFCLTEPDNGSDAANLKTSITEGSDGNYILSGQKRWIGNASIANFLIVWARNSKNKKVEGYIVPSCSKGITIKPMKGKLSTQGVINSDITFDNVVVDKSCKLEGAKDYNSGVNKMMLGSRLAVCWAAVGVCIGAYERVIKYCTKRKQFGKHIAGFQLVQEKLVKIMANTQAMLYMVKRASDLYINNDLSLGQVGMCKYWCTTKARETLAMARDLFGGNGILAENWIMRAMMDAESFHTYEGAADINLLVCGKELTGISAVK